MKYCPKCNKEYNDDFNFCPHCSGHLSIKPEQGYCQDCGMWVDNYYGFSCCPNCNGDLIRESTLRKFEEVVIQQEKEYRKHRVEENDKLVVY